ncbi:MAG: hypothetical protein K2L12_06630 [Clostridia bacterium]|nr:hypothetical protein [Clostridia bacterium]
MTFIKYLVKCILDFFDFFNPPTIAFWREIIIGFVIVLVLVSIFVVSFIFLNWYLALLITIGVIIAFSISSILIEFIIKKMTDKK